MWAQHPNLIPQHAHDDSSQVLYTDTDDGKSGSTYSMESSSSASSEIASSPQKKRSYFDSNMVDPLGRIIIIKIYSHQLNKDLTLKIPSKIPSLNLFIVSANQYTDNAASQAGALIHSLPSTFDRLFYPPFSPRWCFTFEGCITNKGATRVFQEKLENNLTSECIVLNRDFFIT